MTNLEVCLMGHAGDGNPEPARGCSNRITTNVTRGDNPEFGGTYSRVSFDAEVFCTAGFYPAVTGRALLVDRTPGYDGNILATGGSLPGGASGC